MDGFGHDGADVGDGLELLGGGVEDGIEGAKGAGEAAGGAFADVGDAEAVEESPEVAAPAVVNGVDEVGGGFFTHAFEGLELGGGEGVEVGEVGDEAFFDELVNEGFAEAFDVHGGASGEVADGAFDLGGAGDVFAAPGDEFGVAVDGAAAGGADAADVGEEVEGGGVGRPEGGNDVDDGGNDLSGFFDDDGVADADVFAADFFFVVEGGAGDGGASEEDGVEFGDGGEGSGAADLDGDGAEEGLGLFVGVFVGDGEAGGFGGGAEFGPEGEFVEFDDGAIDVVGEVVFVALEFFDAGDDVVDAGAGPPEVGDGEAGVAEGFDFLMVVGEGDASGCADGVTNGGEGAFGDDGGIELFEGACGGVAGVGEEGFAGGFAFAVEFGEAFAGEVGFAADFEEFGRVGEGEAKGEGVEGFEVLGDVVSGGSVAPGGAEGEEAVLVAEADGDAVDFGFDDVGEVVAGGEFDDAAVEFAEFVEVVGVVEGKHGEEVIHTLKLLEGRSANAPGGGVGGGEFGMFVFEADEFFHEPVEVAVGDLGGGVLVVETGMAFNFAAEVFDAWMGGGGIHRDITLINLVGIARMIAGG